MNSILRKTGVILLGAALLAAVLTACSPAAESTIPAPTTTTTQPTTTTATQTTTPTQTLLTITDQLGRTMTIENTRPQKIISLAPSNTEILFALGLGDRVVGVTDYCNYPPEAQNISSIGAYDNPNIEEIIAKEPDLVLGTEAQSESTYAQLESRGLTVVGLSPKSVDEVLDSITLVGKITGQDKEAADLVADMQQRINAITDKTEKLTGAQRLRVFYIIWHDPIWTTGTETFADALIELAGGVNIAHDLTGYAAIELENVIAANPQVIIAGVGMGTGEDLTLQAMQTDERLKDTEARLNNRIYSVNMDVIGRPGPRIVDALEEFFRLIHPEME